jgi:hypothetical protein
LLDNPRRRLVFVSQLGRGKDAEQHRAQDKRCHKHGAERQKQPLSQGKFFPHLNDYNSGPGFSLFKRRQRLM